MVAPRKRIEQKRDHRVRDRPGDGGASVTRLPVRGVVDVPPVSRSWHRVARQWYRSLAASGQSAFFEPSDWQGARVVAEQMSLLFRQAEASGEPVQASAFVALWSAMGDLLTSEGSRRRVRVGVEDPGEQETAAIMRNYAEMFKDSGPLDPA